MPYTWINCQLHVSRNYSKPAAHCSLTALLDATCAKVHGIAQSSVLQLWWRKYGLLRILWFFWKCLWLSQRWMATCWGQWLRKSMFRYHLFLPFSKNIFGITGMKKFDILITVVHEIDEKAVLQCLRWGQSRKVRLLDKNGIQFIPRQVFPNRFQKKKTRNRWKSGPTVSAVRTT